MWWYDGGMSQPNGRMYMYYHARLVLSSKPIPSILYPDSHAGLFWPLLLISGFRPTAPSRYRKVLLQGRFGEMFPEAKVAWIRPEGKPIMRESTDMLIACIFLWKYAWKVIEMRYGGDRRTNIHLINWGNPQKASVMLASPRTWILNLPYSSLFVFHGATSLDKKCLSL